ncbi:MAG: hypothetical protein HWN68_13950 [Desulfobacterales bacterium]|nr:hypothetical protein [Desulfobacterales bacterium]
MKLFNKLTNSLKRKYWSRQVKKGIMVLESLDGMMRKAHWSRPKRRRFWKDFVKRQANREEIYGELRRASYQERTRDEE